MSIEFLDFLKLERDISIKPMFRGGKTTFRRTLALSQLSPVISASCTQPAVTLSPVTPSLVTQAIVLLTFIIKTRYYTLKNLSRILKLRVKFKC